MELREILLKKFLQQQLKQKDNIQMQSNPNSSARLNCTPEKFSSVHDDIYKKSSVEIIARVDKSNGVTDEQNHVDIISRKKADFQLQFDLISYKSSATTR